MSDAQSQTSAGEDDNTPQRPTGERLTDASAFVANHLASLDTPAADTKVEQAAAAEAQDSDGVPGAGADVAASPEPEAEAEAEEAEAPVSGADLPPPIMPYMLPPMQDGADTALPPMMDDYDAATDGDPSPLRFLREPVQYVGNDGKLVNGGAQPAAAEPELDLPPALAVPEMTERDAASPAEDHTVVQAATEPPPAPHPGGNASSILSAIDAAERNVATPEGLNLRLSIRVPRMQPDEPVAAAPEAPVAHAQAVVQQSAGIAEPQSLSAAPQFDEAPSTPGIEVLPVADAQANQPAMSPPVAAGPPPLPVAPAVAHDDADTVAQADRVAGRTVAESAALEAMDNIPPPLAEPRHIEQAQIDPTPLQQVTPEPQARRRLHDEPLQAAKLETAEPADPVRAAAARIAAEATATAQALESLKKLLESNRLPDPEAVVAPPRQVQRPPLIQPEPPRQRPPAPPPAVSPSMRATAGLPPYIAPPPATPPLPVPIFQPQASGGRIYLLGFLAGFGLALVAGAMLYLFISIG
jgi:hypothetical protein